MHQIDQLIITNKKSTAGERCVSDLDIGGGLDSGGPGCAVDKGELPEAAPLSQGQHLLSVHVDLHVSLQEEIHFKSVLWIHIGFNADPGMDPGSSIF